MIAHKTKAAMPGRLSHNALLKRNQVTRLTAGGQTLLSPVLARSNYHRGFEIRAGEQSLSDTGIPVSGKPATMQICIVLLDNHFPPLSGSAPGILRGINTEVQIISVRLTYGHRNSLKFFQTVNLHSAQNSLSQLNFREMRELANTLIIPKNTNSAVRLPQIEVLEEINNLVPESHLVHGSSTIGGWGGDAFLYHEENQQRPALDCNPDLAYERVVPQSHEVNQLSLSESDRLPTIRGLVTYKNFVGQRLCGTQRPAQHNPDIIVVVHCFTGSKARIRALSYRQTTENPAVNYKIFVVQLSGSDLAFLRCRRCSSSRAILMICWISSPAFMPISSTRVSASMEDSSKACSLPSDCLRVISLRADVTKKPAVDSPLNFTASISSKTSCGMRIDICRDLSLLVFVAMRIPVKWGCDSVYTKINHIKHLLCDSVCYSLNHTLSTGSEQIRHKTAKPRGASTPSGPLTKPLIGVTVMAGSQHTQTHPKFIWRFLALNRHDKKAKPRRLSVEAATERDARRILAPHFILSLAARLPVVEGSHA
ncbi:host cell division inhibitor Icd-like protein [Raoultella terrigena]|uniref:host cell division inhibitor Icd-like protein n=1 Tax=Raoultella terrigena TaxID=577 RepID=UPI0026C7BB9B